jgi:hypothetical protein
MSIQNDNNYLFFKEFCRQKLFEGTRLLLSEPVLGKHGFLQFLLISGIISILIAYKTS